MYQSWNSGIKIYTSESVAKTAAEAMEKIEEEEEDIINLDDFEDLLNNFVTKDIKSII